MGMPSIAGSRCSSDPCNTQAIAPNPNPSNYTIEEHIVYDSCQLLKVVYHGCTNFEGVKLIVYPSDWKYYIGKRLDPHFEDTTDAPIARFNPNQFDLAVAFCICYAVLSRTPIPEPLKRPAPVELSDYFFCEADENERDYYLWDI